jgi:hypothetical protein
MIKYNSRIMELKNTHHSQSISQHKCKLGEKPSVAEVGELGQHKL